MSDDELTDSEITALENMPPHVAAGYLAKRAANSEVFRLEMSRACDESDWDTLRAKLDDIGLDAAAGDPIVGQRVAEFNDLIIEKLRERMQA